MISSIKLSWFKRFKEETLDISDSVLLVGPNNSGKTTLLQAVGVWNLALHKWLAERGPDSGSKASKRTGVPITRKEFTAIPLREMSLLWTNCSTAFGKGDSGEGHKPGQPRILRIDLSGELTTGKWHLAFEITYSNPELIYVKPANDTPITNETIMALNQLQVVHVPPFSGIVADETRLDRAYQDLLIGQGRPGEILRNLLLELYENKPTEWNELAKDIEEIFGYRLLPPQYEGRPYIICQYQPVLLGGVSHLPKFDIASAGSGFLQVLLLLSFFYARSAATLLLDEPDAHLHVILQKQIYDRIRKTARNRGCQLFIATHSEVLVESTSPELILSFFQKPHPLLSEVNRDQVREALRRLTSLDISMADQVRSILYVEGENDYALLREWGRVLNHRICLFFENPFWRANNGRDPREARAHFFALKAVQPDISGVLLLDGDNRRLPDREFTTDGLHILRWERYEAESYLLHPEALGRFVRGSNPNLWSTTSAEKGIAYLREQLPPAIFKDPSTNHEYLKSTPVSKTLIPEFFEKAGLRLSKNEYYQIAAQMGPDEIPIEVTYKLDTICDTLGVRFEGEP
jgi:hypothetical protein